ncbi:MAG: iron complex outermembrane receptor protein [Gammaproteobacteria bacterium]|jgi:iron complex outermembrane receptor protein
MFKRNSLSQAIMVAITAGLVTSSVNAQIEEIVVTATKRSASAQDIPVTVTAFNEDRLNQLNITNFDDFVKNIPNVTIGGRGPGQAEVYIRGMAIDSVSQTVGGAQAAVPNVAVYLDEQPTTSPSRILDVYITDIERVEVLPGPQGSLFGASSMAGTVRIITNKAVVDEFQVGITAGIADTKDGDISHNIEGYINVPVIENKLAVRVAAFNAREGGYIDNVSSSRSLEDSIPLNPALQGLGPDTTFLTVTNDQLAEENFNDATYKGFRASATAYLSNDWQFRVQNMYQELNTDGVFDYDPNVGDLDVERYFPDSLEDKFNQVSWTLEGRISALELLYTGAYLDRNIDQSIDYTGYNNAGAFIAYYTCNYTGYTGLTYRECLTPVKGAVIDQRINRQTHEFRINTDAANRVRLTAGVFYDDFKLETLDEFLYTAVPDLGFAPNAVISTAKNILTTSGVPRAPGVAFFNDIRRTEKQTAIFGELSYDVIPASLTLTAGARYYDMEVDFEGTSNFASGPFSGSVDGDSGRDYDVSFGHSAEPFKQDDVLFKLNASWKPNDDALLYATWSQGFRPGGWNRVGGAPPINPDFPVVPAIYRTDKIDNYELGWKSTWLDGTLQANGAVFFIDWKDMQLARFDPVNISILTFIDNAADAEILGLEADYIWVASDQLTITGAFSITDTELTKASSDVITLVPEGSDLALAPPFQANLRARYEWNVSDMDVHLQGGFQYSDRSFSALAADNRRRQDNHITFDTSIGVQRQLWRAELYVENLFDERSELFFNVADDTPRITTNRPRTIGLRFSYDYESF